MIVKSESIKSYERIFLRRGASLQLLEKSTNDKERLLRILKAIDSDFIFPTEQKLQLDSYAIKLLNNAYNFILINEEHDIGVISIYANDHTSKIAFASTIGLLPSYRGGSFALYLVKFGLEFCKEVGMVKARAEIRKDNSKWLKFLLRQKFEIESETETSYYIIKNL